MDSRTLNIKAVYEWCRSLALNGILIHCRKVSGSTGCVGPNTMTLCRLTWLYGVVNTFAVRMNVYIGKRSQTCWIICWPFIALLYCCLTSVLEYCCCTWHHNISNKLAVEIKNIQTRSIGPTAIVKLQEVCRTLVLCTIRQPVFSPATPRSKFHGFLDLNLILKPDSCLHRLLPAPRDKKHHSQTRVPKNTQRCPPLLEQNDISLS